MGAEFDDGRVGTERRQVGKLVECPFQIDIAGAGVHQTAGLSVELYGVVRVEEAFEDRVSARGYFFAGFIYIHGPKGKIDAPLG